MFGDSLWTGMTIESSGAHQMMRNQGIIERDGALLRRTFACPWRSRRHSGHIRRERVLACRAHAQPLRRQGASRRLAPHLRQPDAKLGADRRRVAAAAARHQCDPRPDRFVLSHRRFRDRDLDRVVRDHGGVRVGDRALAHRIAHGRVPRGGARSRSIRTCSICRARR